MSADRMEKDELPTSFGAFKPVGYVVAALADDSTAQRVVDDLLAQGFELRDLVQYSLLDEHNKLRDLIDNASDVAGFGHEIVLMRRYQELSKQGCSWLMVYAPDDEQSDRVGEVLQKHGALIATKYNHLLIQDLLPAE